VGAVDRDTSGTPLILSQCVVIVIVSAHLSSPQLSQFLAKK
jgi:hypothetical protein